MHNILIKSIKELKEFKFDGMLAKTFLHYYLINFDIYLSTYA